MKETKSMLAKSQWIAETQMFQRIAKVPESSYEELEKEYEEMKNTRRK